VNSHSSCCRPRSIVTPEGHKLLNHHRSADMQRRSRHLPCYVAALIMVAILYVPCMQAASVKGRGGVSLPRGPSSLHVRPACSRGRIARIVEQPADTISVCRTPTALNPAFGRTLPPSPVENVFGYVPNSAQWSLHSIPQHAVSTTLSFRVARLQ